MQLTTIDVFGPLAPCSNCAKTKKTCTFEWLRSQRILNATPQPIDLQPAKKRRKKASTTNSQEDVEANPFEQIGGAPQSIITLDSPATEGGDFLPRNQPAEFGVTFADFPASIPTADCIRYPSLVFDSEPTSASFVNKPSTRGDRNLNVLPREDESSVDLEFRPCPSTGTCASSYGGDSELSIVADVTEDHPAPVAKTMVRLPRKRRRRSTSSTLSIGRGLCSSLSPTNDFFISANNAFLSEHLLRIYHDSFENALSCWLTERTCPYSKDSEVSLANDSGPDWNRIYHRVFRLDRLAAPIRGRNLSNSESKAASRAVNAAIFAFATQWAQSSQRGSAKYPFHERGSDERNQAFGGIADAQAIPHDSDRDLRVSAWHEAQAALQEASAIESFRVVLAQIVFSLTQKPHVAGEDEYVAGDARGESAEASSPIPDDISGQDDVDECEGLLAKLDLAMESDGPPVHLEQGLRLIHSLRSRVTMSSSQARVFNRRTKHSRLASDQLSEGDRATIDLLFWLGIMFDTLSSAMHRRPLVVPDEDSDIYANERKADENSIGEDNADEQNGNTDRTEGPWDEHLLTRQKKSRQHTPVHWPCSYSQAASVLCDASPVKVLLFRKVTRIQTLLSRSCRGPKVERAIKAALSVYSHWQTSYDPFIHDCIENHENLPPRIQSWYICLSGHFYLATLLLADLIEIVDDSTLGVTANRHERASAAFVAKYRHTNCVVLSELARRACPSERSSYSFHFGGSQSDLLREPWTAVLIRAFAKAGVILLEADSSSGSERHEMVLDGDAFRRADDCVRALWYLGRRSDMALAAAKILGDALKQKRKGIEEKMNDMSAFLSAELWDGFEGANAAFDVDCSG